jgi:hypothetical protein
MLNFSFLEVLPTEDQISTLFHLLQQRNHVISHKNMPSFQEHSDFVKSHPYRAWYIVLKDHLPIGSFYISVENNIGINVVDSNTHQSVDAIIRFVKNNYSPLPPIKSVRSVAFVINVPFSNDKLIAALDKSGAKKVQITFTID